MSIGRPQPRNTKTYRVDELDREFCLREALRSMLLLHGLVERFGVASKSCIICGTQLTLVRHVPVPADIKPKKLKNLMKALGCVEGKKAWEAEKKLALNWQRDRVARQMFTVTVEGYRTVQVLVCSEECRAIALADYEESKECCNLIASGRMQITAIRQFLKTGNQQALTSLPIQLGPQISSPGACPA